MKLKTTLFGAGVFLLPLIASAQTQQGTPNLRYVNTWLETGISLLRLSLTVLMVLMTAWFLFTVFRYISSKDADAGTRKKQMFNALLGLFIAVSVWGIIRLAGTILGVSNSSDPGGTLRNITCPPGFYYSPQSNGCIPG